MRSFFQRQGKFRPLAKTDERGQSDATIPEDLWTKCPHCGELVYTRELERNSRVCTSCGYHFRLTARERIDLLVDADSFEEWDTEIRPVDPLGFVEPGGSYADKLVRTAQKSGENESLITGRALIHGRPLVLAVTEFRFLGASMGSVFGEKLTRAVERAIDLRLPVFTVNASGGARMHEGVYSLMQLAKVLAAFHRLGEHRLPHVSLLVDPCYGGVPASYATIADVMLAEPGALIGFAGQRVIEQVTRQKLPEGFQTAEFQLEHGMIDQIVERGSIRHLLTVLSDHYVGRPATAQTGYPKGLLADEPADEANLVAPPTGDDG